MHGHLLSHAQFLIFSLIHLCAVFRKQFDYLDHGDKICVWLEPLAKKTVDVRGRVGQKRVAARVARRQKCNITVHLHYSVRLKHGVDKDGDQYLVLGQVKRYPFLVIWVGEEKGKVHRVVRKINASLPRILNTVSARQKSTEKTML